MGKQGLSCLVAVDVRMSLGQGEQGLFLLCVLAGDHGMTGERRLSPEKG